MWDEIWKIVLGVLTSVGGIGGIILIIIKLSCNTIAKSLEAQYTLKLNKELEKYKSNVDKKIYISKTKFDTEFSIYRELSKAFFKMVKDISIMIPIGVASYPADKEAKKKYENELYNNALKSTVLAQDVLSSNVPFISSDLFEKYNYIINICRQQLSVFERRWNVLCIASQEEKENFSMEDYKRTSEINEKFVELNEKIRNYLSKIDVLD